MQQPNAHQVERFLGLQAIFGLILIGITLPFGSPVAISVLIGAGTCWLANILVAAWIFRAYRAQARGRLVARFYRAELVKIVLVLALFGAAVVLYSDLNILSVFVAYVLVQVVPTLITVQSNRIRS
ncbi:F0F1 ATP synthase assembly protein I [Caldichromatium japonicum]|uniref:F0F1 ATP synthase assembly protein I n=1 Tax=Caldichromatium japonicum TaxID=2699430 RepID=A0A6G7VG96_9GAMM|nr:ATP synthase subunit I [Caldichromatium japonicum]QIK38868.1 F0F1 ATP synthase assembly protein I [Caldichromatium japonicum]